MISLKPFSTPQELGKDQASLINFLAMETTTLLAAESKEKINIRKKGYISDEQKIC